MRIESGHNDFFINFSALTPLRTGVKPKSTHKNDCRKISNLPISQPLHHSPRAKILTRFRLSHEETLNHCVQFWMQNLWSSSSKKTQFQANHCSWSGWTQRCEEVESSGKGSKFTPLITITEGGFFFCSSFSGAIRYRFPVLTGRS